MRINFRLPVLIFVLCYCYSADAQTKKNNVTNPTLRFEELAQAGSNSGFFIVHTKGGGDSISGYIQIRQITSDLIVVKKINNNESDTTRPAIIRIANANHRWKYAPALLHTNLLQTHKTGRFTIVGIEHQGLMDVLNKYRLQLKDVQQIPDANAAVVSCSYATLSNLLVKEPAILFVDIYIKPRSEIELIGYDRSLHGIQEIDVAIPGANGKNISIGIKESDMDAQDLDLVKRVKPSSLAHPEKDVHATVVATLAGGGGNSFITGKGLAWKSDFFPSSYNMLFPDNGTILQQNDVSIQNHSYGTIVQSFYGAEAAAYDAQQFNIPYLIHVFSSGNRGTSAATSGTFAGINGFANLTGNFKMSKNSITVGATDTSGSITAFSSAGPLYDGRLGPQITALGPNGTSDAAAIVSGGIAVLQQVYKDSNQQQLPDAALIKALLYNNADDIDQKGIDYKSGYGAVNIFKAVKALQNRKYIVGNLVNGQQLTFPIHLPSNAANIKFTLVWNDPAAAINNNLALVNDIDLELIESGTSLIYKPWILSTFPMADSLRKPAIRGVDRLNNAEQISLERNNGNEYILTVKGSRIIGAANQRFYIAYHWDTIGSFRFISPINASDINLDEGNFVKIKWEAIAELPNETGTLFVSFNNGNFWQPIASSVPIDDHVFNWPVPDTIGTAMFKMEHLQQSWLSNNLIIAPLTKLRVDYFCEDSLQLSWNEHVSAQSYQVFQLTDSAYLKSIAIINGTTIRLPNNRSPSTVFAVQPILSNGLYATRSYAIKPSEQGVACFYNTLLANDLANSIQLELSLSIPSLTDSIVFEKIFPINNDQKKISATIVEGLSSLYTATDNNPLPGLNSYRARIYTKTGSVVFTNIVSIISNAGENIWLYPNPARSGERIQFKLRDISIGNQIQLFNANGQLLKSIPIGSAGNLSTSGWPPGSYLYRIIQADQTILITGKIIITN